MIGLVKYYDLQISVNIVYFQIYYEDISCGNPKKYFNFTNIKFKMQDSQLLIGLETSFKNWQKAQNVNIYSILKAYIWCYPLLAYGLYACENVDNYGWPLTLCLEMYWTCLPLHPMRVLAHQPSYGLFLFIMYVCLYCSK